MPRRFFWGGFSASTHFSPRSFLRVLEQLSKQQMALSARARAADRDAALPSVLRRQENDVVGEVELDLIERKIRERDVLRIDDVVVAVVTDQACSPVFIDLQFPDLERFAGDRLLEALRDRDGIEEPIGAAFVSDVFGAVGTKDLAVDAEPVPVFGAGELPEIFFAKLSCFRHYGPLSLE